MKKIRLVVEILLIVAAVAAAVYSFAASRQPAYAASVVAVFGTVAILIKDVVSAKSKKENSPRLTKSDSQKF